MISKTKTTIQPLSLLLTLGVGAGCIFDEPRDRDSDPGPDPKGPFDASGTYNVQSMFDLGSVPATASAVSDAILATTDGAVDPGEWLVDQIAAGMPDGGNKDVLVAAKQVVAEDLNSKLDALAPGFVTAMTRVSTDFGQMARNVGLNQTFDVSKDGSAYTAKITATGAHFLIDNGAADVAFADHLIATVSARAVPVILDSGTFAIGEHKLPLEYGKMLRLGLDELVIKSIEPTAADLAMLFQSKVNCSAVGGAIRDALFANGQVTPGAIFWGGACSAGLGVGAGAIYAKFDLIDVSPLELSVTGVATALDSNNDSKIDSIKSGTWMGTMSYDGSSAPLATASFTGSRE